MSNKPVSQFVDSIMEDFTDLARRMLRFRFMGEAELVERLLSLIDAEQRTVWGPVVAEAASRAIVEAQTPSHFV